MKLENGNIIDIFWDEKEFYSKLKIFFDNGYHWIWDNQVLYPNISENYYPILLTCDISKTMLYSIINLNKDEYFNDEIFLKLYNMKLRKKKIKRLL